MKFNPETPKITKEQSLSPDLFYDVPAQDWTHRGVFLYIIKPLDLSGKDFQESLGLLNKLEEYCVHQGKLKDSILKKEIQEKLDKPENNYYLNQYLKLVNDGIVLENLNQCLKPFLIQPNQYAIDDFGGGIFLSDNREKTKKDIENLLKYRDLEIDKSNRDWDYKSNEWEIENQLEAMFDERLKISDLLLTSTENKQIPKMNDYVTIMNSGMRQLVEKEFNIKLVDITIPEQFQFLTYLMNAKLHEGNRVKGFTKKFDRNAFKTFLSIEHGGKEMGEKILTLGEKLPEDVAKRLFAKYAEYIDNVANVENFVEDELVGKKAKPETIQKIKETLLIKGRDILVSQYEKVAGGGFDLDKFEEFINNAKADVDLFKNTFKTTLEENPDTSFEDFMNLQANTKKSNEVSKKEVEEIKNMIKRNYKDADLQSAVLSSFEKSLVNPNTKISTLERAGKTIASDRLDFNEDGSIYFGTFNVDPDYCSAKIGNAFFKSTVAPYLKEHIVRADCSVRQPISAYYIESGFVGIKFYDYKGEPSLSIESMPNKDLLSKKLSKEEIIEKLNSGDSQFLIKSFAKQEEIANENIDGKFLTRFFYDSKSNRWIALWE